MGCGTTVFVGNLTIPSGEDESNTLFAAQWFDDAAVLVLQGPASLDALTFTFETPDTNDVYNTNPIVYTTFQDGDPFADLAPPPAGKSRAYYSLPATPGFRIKASGNVAADRTWKVWKQLAS